MKARALYVNNYTDMYKEILKLHRQISTKIIVIIYIFSNKEVENSRVLRKLDSRAKDLELRLRNHAQS